MSPANRTRVFVVGVAAASLIWEALGFFHVINVTLISPVITKWFASLPLVTFLVGVLCGHWIGGRETTAAEESDVR